MKLKSKNNKHVIFLILLFLTSIYIINFNPFVSKSNKVIKNEVEDEDLHNILKTSLMEDWNISLDAGADEYGRSIAIDESTGDIYAVGYNGTSSVHDYDVLLIKYNSNGDQQWNVTWDNGRDEIGYDVAVDSQGYVYVAGSNGTILTNNWDVLLLKFNSSGEQEWNRTWDSGAKDAGWTLKMDSQDNIYIAGQIDEVEKDLLLLKYDSSGEYKWNSTFGGPNGQHGYDLVLDSSNNIYVAGVNGTNPDFNLLLVKFDDLGIHLWNRTWGGTDNDQGFGVVLDSGNGVYITGWTTSVGALNKDMVVVKYDTSGNWQWNRTWGTSLNDEAQSIGVDSADNIYMGGHTLFANVSIVKFSASGELLWDKQWGNTPTYQYWGYDLVIDSLDKIYITGYNRTGNSPGYDIFLAKFSIEAPGEFILSSNAGSPDDDGAFTLTWTSSSGANNYSIFQYSSYITDINGSLTILANETNSLSLPLSGFSNGTYYFKGVAFNDFGNHTSNCISITVEIQPPSPPGSFVLSSNAGTPDDDGDFTLAWTSASGANNYSIYEYPSFITQINGSLTVLASETNSLSHPLSGYSNGIYYFIAVAFNNNGNSISNCIIIMVTIPTQQPSISGFNILIVGLVIGIVSVMLIKKKSKLK